MAEGFSQSASREMDKSGPARESEVVPLIEQTKCTTTEGNLECSPKNLNVFLEKEKTTQKSLYTEILEAEGKSSGEGSTTGESALSEVARDIHAIVTSAAATVDDEVTGPKQCNLPAASAASRGIGEDQPTTSSSVVSRDSMTETQLEACDLAEDARVAVAEGRKVVDVVRQAIEKIEHYKRIAEEKAFALGATDDEASEREQAFHLFRANKCDSALKTLRRKIRRLEWRIKECENAAKTALECVNRGDEVTDLSNLKIRTENSIIGLLRKEYIALWTVRRIWYDDNESSSDSSSGRSEYRQKCENADRNIKLGHGLAFFVGITLLAMTAAFDPKSESLPPIALLGVVITLWCSVFWINVFRKCIQRRRAGAQVTPAEEPTRRRRRKPEFMEYLERRLSYVDAFLQERGMIPRSDLEESDPGSMETVRVEDAAANV